MVVECANMFLCDANSRFDFHRQCCMRSGASVEFPQKECRRHGDIRWNLWSLANHAPEDQKLGERRHWSCQLWSWWASGLVAGPFWNHSKLKMCIVFYSANSLILLGKHMCPGRYLAVYEMKILFTHLLKRYSFRTVNGAAPAPPVDYLFGMIAIPMIQPLEILNRKWARWVGRYSFNYNYIYSLHNLCIWIVHLYFKSRKWCPVDNLIKQNWNNDFNQAIWRLTIFSYYDAFNPCTVTYNGFSWKKSNRKIHTRDGYNIGKGRDFVN